MILPCALSPGHVLYLPLDVRLQKNSPATNDHPDPCDESEAVAKSFTLTLPCQI